MNMNKMGSAIIVVEDNCEHSIGHNSKKDDERQNPSLWRRKVHSLALTAIDRTCQRK